MNLIDALADHIGETYNTLVGSPKVANTKKAFGSSLPVRYGNQLAGRFQNNMAIAIDPNLPYWQKTDATMGLAGLAMTGGIAGVPKGATAGMAFRLPMDTALRLTRAKELGFNTSTRYYHGTDTPIDFKAFNAKYAVKAPEGVISVTTDPKYASEFIGYPEYNWMKSPFPPDGAIEGIHGDFTPEGAWRPYGGRILPLYVKDAPTFDYTNPDHFLLGEKWLKDTYKPKFYGSDKTVYPWTTIEGLTQALKNGEWEVIESNLGKKFMDTYGFKKAIIDDNGTQNLAVFEPSLLRSIFAKFDPAKVNSSDLLAGGLLPFIYGLSNSKENKQ